ncbi:MAG: hypothetical protein WC785_08025 [Tatlockia sp.]|jgi:hypothetical protein
MTKKRAEPLFTPSFGWDLYVLKKNEEVSSANFPRSNRIYIKQNMINIDVAVKNLDSDSGIRRKIISNKTLGINNGTKLNEQELVVLLPELKKEFNRSRVFDTRAYLEARCVYARKNSVFVGSSQDMDKLSSATEMVYLLLNDPAKLQDTLETLLEKTISSREMTSPCHYALHLVYQDQHFSIVCNKNGNQCFIITPKTYTPAILNKLTNAIKTAYANHHVAVKKVEVRPCSTDKNQALNIEFLACIAEKRASYGILKADPKTITSQHRQFLESIGEYDSKMANQTGFKRLIPEDLSKKQSNQKTGRLEQNLYNARYAKIRILLNPSNDLHTAKEALATQIQTLCKSNWSNYIHYQCLTKVKKPEGVAHFKGVLDAATDVSKVLEHIISLSAEKHSSWQLAHRLFRGRDTITNQFYGILRKIKLDDLESVNRGLKHLITFQKIHFDDQDEKLVPRSHCP